MSSSALLAGDIVDFGYTDPTGGNDVNAIQSTFGNDASSFSRSIVIATGRPDPAPVVSSLAVTGPGLTNGSGSLTVGQTATFTLTLSEPVTRSEGTSLPTLSLSNGGHAVLDTAQSTSTALVFTHTVAVDEIASDLAITAINLNGGAIRDSISQALNTTGVVTNPPGLLALDGYTGTGADETFHGTTGAETFRGRGGDDTYTVDHAGDLVIEVADNGTDTVRSSLGHTLAANVEKLILTGGSDLDGTGNALANALTGNAGANLLDGQASADTMTGLSGNDRYIVDNASDQVVEATGGGTNDRVYVRPGETLASYALAAGQEVETLATTRAVGGRSVDLTGNEKVQTICGNAGANVLDGKGAADTLQGYGGADTFAFSTALGSDNVDRIVDFSSQDTIRLSKGVFGALDLGTLDASAFKDLGVLGATVDANDHILYDGKGRLFYDADGAGGDEAVLFAKLSYKPALTHDDIFVV